MDEQPSLFNFLTTTRSISILVLGMIVGLVIASLQLVYPSLFSIRLPTFDSLFSKSVEHRPYTIENIQDRIFTGNIPYTLKTVEPTVSPPSASVKAFGVANFDTGDVVASEHLHDRLPIASLTKLMSAMVALDLVNPDVMLTTTKQSAEQIPTKIGLLPGQKLTVKELLSAMLLTSANDATEVIREGIDTLYGQPVFIDAMNEKARYLGLENTHFDNPQGFDSASNYSSAADLITLTRVAFVQYPLIAQLVATSHKQIPQTKNHSAFSLTNWNSLLDVYPGAMGVKIGNTGSAGYTSIVLAKKADTQVIAVVLGADGVLARDLFATQLLDTGFAALLQSKPVAITAQTLHKKYSSWKL